MKLTNSCRASSCRDVLELGLVKRGIAAITFGVASVASAPVHAESDRQPLVYYRIHTEKVLRNAARMVEPALSPDEREIQSRVSVRVPLSEEVGAYARRSPSGKPEILISAGLTRVLEWLATAEISEVHFGTRGCLEDYSTYLLRGIAENSQRVKSGEQPRPVFGPALYARRNRGACDDLRSDFTSSQVAGEHFAGAMDASLCFLYLHEFGHHVLHHVGNTESLAISRAQEAAADAWAISTAFEARFNLAAASPAFNFVAGLGGGSLEDEVKQTHPLGIRRVVSMLTEARDIMARNSDPHVADLDRTIAEIRKRIPVR